MVPLYHRKAPHSQDGGAFFVPDGPAPAAPSEAPVW